MASLIEILPSAVADRIAAGEVVERPASVVKELVENALDAGATHLEVDLEEGGSRLIRVRDDGAGMSPEDARLCVLPHATSKIRTVDDLFRVASFGFRGEALPSIASVAELTLSTRPPSDELGTRVEDFGGEGVRVTPTGAPVGTTVEVRNLFFNVPARKKFLKTPRTETNACLETLTRLMLPDPSLSLVVTLDGRRWKQVRPAPSRRERIAAFFGETVASRLLQVTAAGSGVALEGFVGPPDLVRSDSRDVLVFVNGRSIRDRGLVAIVRTAYRGLTMPKDHPVAFLFLTVDPATVDVNAHPTKAEVRFQDKDRVFGLVHRSLRDVLVPAGAERAYASPKYVGPAAVAETSRPRETARASDLFSTQSLTPTEIVSARAHVGVTSTHPASPPPLSGRSGDGCRPALLRGWIDGPPKFLQIHRSYVIVEAAEGLRIVDQHALHERKLYEELLARFRSGHGEDQRLLIPEVVDVSAADAELLLQSADALSRLGVQIEAFGGASVCVRSLPAELPRLSASRWIDDVLPVLRDGSEPGTGVWIERVAAELACRAAVKFSDPLPESQIAALLAWYEAHPEARNCPHGRPVALSLDLAELELRFQRKR